MRFAEGLTPLRGGGGPIRPRHARCACRAPMAAEAVLPARAILVAAGTQPNTVLAREDGRIRLDGRYFQAVDETGTPVTPERGARQAGRDARC